MDFPGGIEKIEISDNEAFDGSGDVSIEVSRDVIGEGTEFPEPEAVTAQLADDREVNMGKDQPFSIRLTSLDTAAFDSLESAEGDTTGLFIKVSSLQKTDAGDPKAEVTYKRAILSHVNYAAINADRSEYGTVMIDGRATGTTVSDIKDVVMN
jgi:hypothetical protein